jgi:general secretion pathway protein G
MCSDHSATFAPPTARRRRRGFSLIELTMVLALIGLLAGIVTVSTRSVMTRGKQNAARGEIATLASAVETFYTAYGRYPTNDEGLAILTTKSDKFPEPLISQIPLDPWSHPYVYLQPGRGHAYEIICLGADGRESGQGADADIVSWDLKEKQK